MLQTCHRQTLVLLCLLECAPARSEETNRRRTWGFESDTVGEQPNGFKSYVGTWVVKTLDGSQVLAQTAMNPNSTFNITLVPGTDVEDVDITVKMNSVAGEIDQGGGVVWRAQDEKNYYLARYNPLEGNYRLYKVIDGKRTLLQNADIAHSDGWHTLHITMRGNQIQCDYDGKNTCSTKTRPLPKQDRPVSGRRQMPRLVLMTCRSPVRNAFTRSICFDVARCAK